jgi:hypothetical protein
MTRVNLAIPFFKKDKLKQFKPKWDITLKTWYFEGDNMPDELKPYIEQIVDVSYEDKDEYKALFPSMKFDKNEKSWKCSTEDYEKIMKYRGENPE